MKPSTPRAGGQASRANSRPGKRNAPPPVEPAGNGASFATAGSGVTPARWPANQETCPTCGAPAGLPVTVAEIIGTVAAAYGVAPIDLVGPSHLRRYVAPRHLAMWLACHLLGSWGMKRIAHAFRRERTTVIDAREKLNAQIEDAPAYVWAAIKRGVE